MLSNNNNKNKHSQGWERLLPKRGQALYGSAPSLASEASLSPCQGSMLGRLEVVGRKPFFQRAKFCLLWSYLDTVFCHHWAMMESPTALSPRCWHALIWDVARLLCLELHCIWFISSAQRFDWIIRCVLLSATCYDMLIVTIVHDAQTSVFSLWEIANFYMLLFHFPCKIEWKWVSFVGLCAPSLQLVELLNRQYASCKIIGH